MNSSRVATVLCIACLLNGGACGRREGDPASLATGTSIKLDIIFYGLIAFVPSNSESDLMAILVDGSGATGVKKHVPALSLLLGNCKKGCDKLPAAGAGAPAGSWGLQNLDLHLQGFRPTNKKIVLGKAPGEFPHSAQQSTLLSWVPQMGLIHPGTEIVRGSCFKTNPNSGLFTKPCPTLARVRIAGWETAEACHLVHDKDGKVASFRFHPRGQPIPSGSKPQAVADASRFQWKVVGSEVKIGFGEFGREKSEITLTPDRSGIISIIIWNHPEKPNKPGDPRVPHFEAYFEISSGPTTHLEVPNFGSSDKVEIGTCETLFQQLDPLLAVKNETKSGHFLSTPGFMTMPHNIRECDSLFFASTLPADEVNQ